MIAALGMGLAQAQVPKGQGYVFQGVGASAYRQYAEVLGATGGGGEGVFWKGLGAGADISAAYPYRYVRGAIGLASVSAVYHFTAGREDTKWDPFVLGGYTLMFRSGTAHAYHVGGGMTYWFHRRLGARVEFRDQRDRYSELAFPVVRFGISFR